MKRATLIVLALLGLAVTSSAGVFVLSAGSSNIGAPDLISNEGTPVDTARLSAQARNAVVTSGATGAPYLLGIRANRAYYRFVGGSGPDCYGVGRAGNAMTFGSIACPEGFPSEETPLLDQSVVTFEPSTGKTRLVRVEGIASDLVARVAIVDGEGKTYSVDVDKNLYSLPAAVGASPYALLAFREDGTQIMRTELARK